MTSLALNWYTVYYWIEYDRYANVNVSDYVRCVYVVIL